MLALASNHVQAIIEGASDIPSPNHGFALDIMNNSWVSSLILKSLEEAVAFAWENQVTMVASRGNWDADPQYAPYATNNIPLYPACYREEWVINVGGSNECGTPKTGLWPYGDGNPLDDADNFSGTMIGHNVDVIAPMTNLMVSTTGRAIVDANGTINYPSTPSNGTSSSAAQVSGVVALLMSYFNVQGSNGYQKYLAPEDIEFILEHSAQQNATQDLDQFGHSNSGGWGNLRADAALQYIEKPIYDIFHFSGYGASSNTSEGVFEVYGYGPNGRGTYRVERFRVEKTLNHALASNFQIMNHWPRHSGSNVFDNSNLNYDHSYVWFQGVPNQLSAQMYGYTYKVIAQKIGTVWAPFPSNTWYPKSPANCKFAYSLRVKDIGVGLDEVFPNALEVYPVPARDILNIKTPESLSYDAELRLIDLAGKVIFESRPNTSESVFQIETRKIPTGIYLVSLRSGGQIFSKRVSISH